MDATHHSPILVVEDNTDDSELLVRRFARAGLDDSVTVISNGQDALDFLSRLASPPRVIFLDLKLPGLTGIELLRRIKQLERLQSAPVVIVSGQITPEEKAIAESLGVTDFLPKPIELSAFIKIVANTFPSKPKA